MSLRCIFWVIAVDSIGFSMGLSTRDCLHSGICEVHECLGGDWGCYNQSNTQVGGTDKVYRIRNARWPNYFLELEDFRYHSRSMVAKGRSRAAATSFQWTIMKLPTKSVTPSYMLLTEQKRDEVLTFGLAGCSEPLPSNGTDPGVESGELNESDHPQRRLVIHGNCAKYLMGVSSRLSGLVTVDEVTMSFIRPPTSSGKAGVDLVMLNAPSYANEFLCYATGTEDLGNSMGVTTCEGDAGFGGYWFFDPPLPATEVASLPAYSGPTCSRRCGEMGAIGEIGGVYINRAASSPSTWLVLMLSLAVAFGVWASAT